MKLVYYLVFALWYALSLLPLRVLYLLSDLLYFPLYYVVRYRRGVERVKDLLKQEKTDD